MNIELPKLCLVTLVGPTGAGKSTFAARHFAPTEVVSSDACRAMISDDPGSHDVTADAFDLAFEVLGKRLKNGRIAVLDATSVTKFARDRVVALAREYDVLPIAIVLDVDPQVCASRSDSRVDRPIDFRVARRHSAQLRKGLRGLKREGFKRVYVLNVPEEIDAATVERVPLWNDRRDDHGPFDLIGDVHGCIDELRTLLSELGYAPGPTGVWAHPERRALFVGDLVDRGPDSPAVLELAMDMCDAGTALCVPGNHDVKLGRALEGRRVTRRHGLAETLEQLEQRDDDFRERVRRFVRGLVSHLVLDDGKLVVAHAGLPEQFQGRSSGRVRALCLYGDTTGELTDEGFPLRIDWAADYKGKASVVYGHTPVRTAVWRNNTLCLDTACVFGGALSALRYPEREVVRVPAARAYWEAPEHLVFGEEEGTSDSAAPRLEDVTGRGNVRTRFDGFVRWGEGQSTAALESMSRFAVDPRWLVYLPPTMSPPEASKRADVLEHPEEAFAYFADAGVETVVCEEKHMGSRAVLVVCRTAEAAAERFGVTDGKRGVIYTRYGRPFFSDDPTEAALVERVAAAIGAAGVWESLGSDWVVLDAELMPWSAKAQSLIASQYAPVGAAARAAFGSATEALERCAAHQPEATSLLERTRERAAHLTAYAAAYRHYCWDVASLDDYAIAPFHILASEGEVHTDKTHVWHMETLHAICARDPILRATNYRVVAVHEPSEVAAAAAWWTELVAAGGEGMVVKPNDWNHKGVQPAIKCRGPEYLRIIYGPEYRDPALIGRLRNRKVNVKRRMARREFALGIEALERFVRKESVGAVHAAVFGVLAMESEEVDPRL